MKLSGSATARQSYSGEMHTKNSNIMYRDYYQTFLFTGYDLWDDILDMSDDNKNYLISSLSIKFKLDWLPKHFKDVRVI